MKRQTAGIAILLLIVLAAVIALVFWQRGDEETLDTVIGLEADDPTSETIASDSTWTANLYFPSASGLLYAEPHEVAASDLVSERIAAVVAQLLAGPRGVGLLPPLPADVGVRRVYLAAGGIAYLDLESAEGAPPPASGSSREMLTLYSLVNTVSLNFEEVERLVLLWNGRQLETFAGHMDTRRPLSANPGLIARLP